MLVLCVILELIALSAAIDADDVSDINLSEDGRLNFTELSEKYGHKAEELEVITDDGYILKFFHIPGKKKPVLILHGLYDSADTWIIRGRTSLAITLADADYDVYVGNVRGNTYCRNHISLDPDKDEEFWDFSFHEMGFYDWTAMIDTILEKTQESKINAIGHSQGTTSMYALLATRPEYNDKVNLFIGFAPITNYENSMPPLPRAVAPLTLKTLEVHGINELLPNELSARQLLKLFCTHDILTDVFCEADTFSMTGYNPTGINLEFFRTVWGHFPAGASRKSVAHLEQLALNDVFANYDYGMDENQRIYGSPDPPEYDLSNVKAKCALMYGDNDVANSVPAVRRLESMLPNVVYSKPIAKKGWSHADFNWGPETPIYLYPEVLGLLEKYDW